jgi:hypothetical protein
LNTVSTPGSIGTEKQFLKSVLSVNLGKVKEAQKPSPVHVQANEPMTTISVGEVDM